MTCNWQLPEWPNFTFDATALFEEERLFLMRAGVIAGAAKHLSNEDHNDLAVELLASDAVSTSAIEGEILNRASVQSSIRAQLGLPGFKARQSPAEQAAGALIVSVYERYEEPLTHDALCQWHKLLLAHDPRVRDVGRYRRGEQPMQIVSDVFGDPSVHFEAPPAHRVRREMTAFLKFLQDTGPHGVRRLGPLVRSGLAHLYFESIHPFEDGNGRLGRAISEKCLAESLGAPTITGLSIIIDRRRKDYYAQLGRASRNLDASTWLHWFATAALAAQDNTRRWVDFLIAKTRLLDGLRGILNPRQEKALFRMLKDGPDGFEGGLSASNYQRITGAPPATARRDLAGLVAAGALSRTGALKGTRYQPVLPGSADPRPLRARRRDYQHERG